MPTVIQTANGPKNLYEMWDGFKKGIDIQRGPFIEQTYLTDFWADTNAIVNVIMGSTSSSASGPAIHVPGFPCPTSLNLTCMDAYVIGEAEYNTYDGGHAAFNLPKIHVIYGIRSWEQVATDDPQGMQSFPSTTGPTTYAIHAMDFGTESVKIPGSAYTFAGTSTVPFDVPAVVHIGVCTLSVELKKVPYLPSITILNLIGKVNNDTFFGAPLGRVLFLGARTSKEFESDGTRVQNVSYSFKYRAHSWNRFLHPKTAKWSLIEDVDGDPPYEYADLRPLIALQGFAGMGTITDSDP
jgi:hypothetical protein